MKRKDLVLFGADLGWFADQWTASDDRIRGGKSQSYLSTDGPTAEFHGTLDIKTLGGAGFASQRTTGDDRVWDLSSYKGVVLEISGADDKQYTFILKDEILPTNEETGREQSTISYEYDFSVTVATPEKPQHVYIAWDQFKATYRGKEKQDATPLKTKQIRRVSMMMRSFFGTQEGEFSLSIRSISSYADHSAEIEYQVPSSLKRSDDQTSRIAVKTMI